MVNAHVAISKVVWEMCQHLFVTLQTVSVNVVYLLKVGSALVLTKKNLPFVTSQGINVHAEQRGHAKVRRYVTKMTKGLGSAKKNCAEQLHVDLVKPVMSLQKYADVELDPLVSGSKGHRNAKVQ